MVEYNEPELRKKLLKVYERFVEAPSDKKNLEEIQKLEENYSPLLAANDYTVSQPVSKTMAHAIGFLYTIWSDLTGLTEQITESPRKSEEELLSEAKKILKELRD